MKDEGQLFLGVFKALASKTFRKIRDKLGTFLFKNLEKLRDKA